MPTKLEQTALNRVRGAWMELFAAMRNLDRTAVVRPAEGTDIFKSASMVGSRARVETGPVVLKVRERAYGKSGTSLFVVVRGSIDFEVAGGNGALRAVCFSTNVAYFKETSSEVKHVFGVHFDFDRTIAHPIFHAQMRSHNSYYEEVRKRFWNRPSTEVPSDCVKGLLSNVKLPTAQMDFFSVVLLICSDHLINPQMGSQGSRARERYGKVRAASGTMSGYGIEHKGLKEAFSERCLRSHFWYADPN